MRELFFSPHSDDAALWTSFNLLKAERPTVINVFRSEKQLQDGITARQRENEDRCAFKILGNPSWVQWTFSDINPVLDLIEYKIRILSSGIYEHFYAPYPEEHGNQQHNFVGEICQKYVPKDKLTLYMTYQWPEGKSRSKNRVERTEAMMQRKINALSFYKSQINNPATAAHFLSDFEEYVV